MINKLVQNIKRNLFKFPSFFIVIPYIVGIIASYFIVKKISFINLNFSILIQIILTLSTIILYVKVKKNSGYFFILFLLLLCLGLIRFSFVYHKYSENNISGKIAEFKGKTLKLYGALVEQPDQNENRIKLIINTDSIFTNNNSIPVHGNVMIYVYKNKYIESFTEKIEYGDYIEISGNLEELPHRRNPGEFDYGEYLKLHDVRAVFSSYGYEKIKLIEHTSPDYFKKNIFYPIKKYSLFKIDEYMGGDEGEFMKGLVLGDRSNISKEIRENFVNDGISHIIAVSGLNVACVIIIISLFLQLFPLKNIYKIIITILALLFYMNLTGNVPSIVRATVMSCVFLISLLIERKSLSLNVISFAALIILLIDPRQLFDAGFILSFWAILSLFLIYPRLENIISKQKFYYKIQEDTLFSKSAKVLILLIIGTLAAQIGTIPITAIMFKKISLVSLITNMVAIPVSNIGMAMGFLMILVSLVSAWAASAIAVSAAFLLQLLLKFIDFFANLNFSFVNTFNLDLFFLVCFYLSAVVLFFIKKFSLTSRLILVILIILNFLFFDSLKNKSDKVRLTYLDVGNSSSCLITTPSNYTAMINAGTSTTRYSSAENNVIPYLKLLGKNHVDLLIISSMNKDEFKNLISLVKNFPVSRMLVPQIFKSIIETAGINQYFYGINIEYLDSSKILDKTNGLRFVIECDKVTKSKLNISVNYGEQKYVFNEFQPIPNQTTSFTAIAVNTSVLKVPSSGSFTLISPDYIIKTNPVNVIISSRGERKQLNSDVFSSSLTKIGINVFKTSEHGAIIFETDGNKTDLVNWE